MERRKQVMTVVTGAPRKDGRVAVADCRSTVRRLYNSRVKQLQRCSFAGCTYTSRSKMGVRVHETRTHPESRKCSFCEHVASSQRELVKHVHRLHAAENDLTCDRCGYRGVNEARLLTHQRLRHGFSAKQERRHLACRETDKAGVRCTERFKFLSQLRSHLAERHAIAAADIKLTQQFQTIDKFHSWKAAYDQESGADYRPVAEPLVAGASTMFACSRSGRCPAGGARSFENRGFRCTSTIRASSTAGGRVYVTLFPYHYGHDRSDDSDTASDTASDDRAPPVDPGRPPATRRLTARRVVAAATRRWEDTSEDTSAEEEVGGGAAPPWWSDEDQEGEESPEDRASGGAQQEVVEVRTTTDNGSRPGQTVIVVAPKRLEVEPPSPAAEERHDGEGEPEEGEQLPAAEGRGPPSTPVGLGRQAEVTLREVMTAAAHGRLPPAVRDQISSHLYQIRALLPAGGRARRWRPARLASRRRAAPGGLTE